MTPYYVLAIAFGGLSALLSAYAIWVRKEHAEFPGRLYVPIMLAGAVFAAATLTFVIVGGNKENKQKHEETAQNAGLVKSSPAVAG